MHKPFHVRYVPKKSSGRELQFVQEKPLTINKRHQIVMTELEIGAVGSDFSSRTSWWARENPGRARTWKSMEKRRLVVKCIQLQKVLNNVSSSYSSGWNWVHPEQEDDARRHCKVPGPRNWQMMIVFVDVLFSAIHANTKNLQEWVHIHRSCMR
jgi:hypothetical protein